VKELSLAIYAKGAQLAEKRGIVIADTKFEFGFDGQDLILIDEVLTPDSSRFWPQASYRAGGSQKSYDKQYLRDYLLSIQWNKMPPAPALPDDVVHDTRMKYLEALTRLTGTEYAFA
jgi:phosphoribosylaminoimidazole-succinocarboxamide synthase